MSILQGNEEQKIKQAADLLRQGNLIAIPTETVYGLAAIITDETAIKKIYQLKHRPLDHPLIVHIGYKDLINRYAENIPDYVHTLLQHFWPGPLTVVLPKSNWVSSSITGNQNTVALRMPAHPTTLKLLQAITHGVAAPSANKFGSISPTSAQHVQDEFADEVPILDGGDCQIGIESTIVNVTHPQYLSILRPGHITQNDLIQVLAMHSNITIRSELGDIRSPGRFKRHYAPRKPMMLFSTMNELLSYQEKWPQAIYVIHYSIQFRKNHLSKEMRPDPLSYAHELYSALREADHSIAAAIAVEKPPIDEAWNAIHDRLIKSSANVAHTHKMDGCSKREY